MRVKDVPGDRWRRSMRFLRTLGNALAWNNDRIALAVFAHIATPQVRLTKDPNTFFFFVDHLEERSPYRLEDDTTWDTNLEQGIYWGLRLIEKDEELYGKNANAKLFVMISDGESWSGEVESSLEQAVQRGIPLFAVGAGTLAGGRMPEVPKTADEEEDVEPPPTYSRLDRQALAKIAAAGGGQYFELERDDDRRIANAIIDTGRRMAPTLGVDTQYEELYWWFLSVSAAVTAFGLVFLRDQTELWMQMAGAGLTLFTLARYLW
jgi:hypothetical protein